MRLLLDGGRNGRRRRASMLWAAAVACLAAAPAAGRPAQPPASPAGAGVRALLDGYCAACHNDRLRTAGLSFDGVDAAHPEADPALWEKVVARLRAGSMPPPGRPRPDAAAYAAAAAHLEGALDAAWAADPRPGRGGAVHRLNRTEYANAVRDLFALDVDVEALLPGDETADGSFDNFADVLTISRSHLERYLSVARQVTRLAVGLPPPAAGFDTFEVPLHVVQDGRQHDDLPLGSRGGLAVRHQFPVDGEYVIRVRLRRQYQAYLMGMGWPQQLDVRLDGRLLKRFTVGGDAPGIPAAASYAGAGEPGFVKDPAWEAFMQLTGDDHLRVRVPVEAGPRTVGVSFVRERWEPEGLPQPLQRGRVITNDQIYMDYASVGAVEIGGALRGRRAGSPTHRADRPSSVACTPASDLQADERACAERDPGAAWPVWRIAARCTAGDVGVAAGVLRPGPAGGRRRLRGTVSSSRSSACWSTPTSCSACYRDPIGSAERERTASTPLERHRGRVAALLLPVEQPARRRAADPGRGGPRSPTPRDLERPRPVGCWRTRERWTRWSMTSPSQWLNLRRVDEVVVDPIGAIPTYDARRCWRRSGSETELLRGGARSRDDRERRPSCSTPTTRSSTSAWPGTTGCPNIYGSRLSPRGRCPTPRQRGGLLAQGALLATTSYPDRTSPVLRGKWLLDNILGVEGAAAAAGRRHQPRGPARGRRRPRPSASASRSIAESPTCASCHSVIDPIGFSLEHFDVIGGWRTARRGGAIPWTRRGTTTDGELRSTA